MTVAVMTAEDTLCKPSIELNSRRQFSTKVLEESGTLEYLAGTSCYNIIIQHRTVLAESLYTLR
jgi:hypothetical protein